LSIFAPEPPSVSLAFLTDSLAKLTMQKVNLFLLKLRAVLTWENEEVTMQLLLLSGGVSLLLLAAPRLAYELAIWIYIFTKRFRSGRFSLMVKTHIAGLWDRVPLTPLWEKTAKEPHADGTPLTEPPRLSRMASTWADV
jgi:hypothetical protein